AQPAQQAHRAGARPGIWHRHRSGGIFRTGRADQISQRCAGGGGGSFFSVCFYALGVEIDTGEQHDLGGLAGGCTPWAAGAAVPGRVDLPALVLFAIIFFWTPPHFWALALRYRSEYAAANVPMLPVTRGEEETRRQIFVYSLLLVGVTLMLYFTGGAGVAYL